MRQMIEGIQVYSARVPENHGLVRAGRQQNVRMRHKADRVHRVRVTAQSLAAPFTAFCKRLLSFETSTLL